MFFEGFGWLTFNINYIKGNHAIKDSRGNECDNVVGYFDHGDSCDLYVLLFIDENRVFKSQIIENERFYYEFGDSFKSKKIRREAKIRIEVWDDDSGFLGSNDDFVNGSEEEFAYSFATVGTRQNSQITIGSIAFWKDEVA